jgi:hypothetical protein
MSIIFLFCAAPDIVVSISGWPARFNQNGASLPRITYSFLFTTYSQWKKSFKIRLSVKSVATAPLDLRADKIRQHKSKDMATPIGAPLN